MKITICGSIAFIKEMISTKAALEKLGHEVDLPPSVIKDNQGKDLDVLEYYKMRHQEENPTSWIWDTKKEAMLRHFYKVTWGDVILVLNPEKNGIPGYIGPNTFLEMGLALCLEKRIFVLNPLPDPSPYREELLGLKPLILNGDLTKII